MFSTAEGSQCFIKISTGTNMGMLHTNRDIGTKEKSVLFFLKCIPEGKLQSILSAETKFDFCKLCKNCKNK